MDYCLDIKDEYQKAKSKLFRLSLLFSIVFALVLTGDVLLIVLAGEEYLVNYIIASVLTVLFTWFAIFFFVNIYSVKNAQYRYYRGYDSGIKPEEEVEFLKKSDELCYINGLYVYPVYVRFIIGLNRQDKVIFALTNDLQFEMGDRITITTYQRILVKAEKHV